MRYIKIIQHFVLAFLIVNTCKAQVIINEYSASNLTNFVDNFGAYEDWIELFNTTGTPVNLTGYHLSDKASNLNKWTFGNVTIPANGFLRIWASSKNINAGANLHTNFNLKQCKYDKIILSNASSVILDSLTMKKTQIAHSRGRSPNGSVNWRVFTAPTPNASNNAATAYLGYAPTPTMNLAAGFYSSSQSVSITAGSGVIIRYTLNGANPIATSPTYTGAVSINTTQVLRAVAFPTTATTLSSFIESNTYFINVTHSVNVVSVFGNQIQTLMGGTQLQAESGLEYYDNLGGLKTESYGRSNEHGNDSWAYPQRGIDFVCRDEYGYTEALKYQIFDLKTRTEYQRLILKAGANDNYPFEGQANSNFAGELGGAHIRDQYVHTLSQKAKLYLDERTWAPGVVYVNGLYWGVYDFREKVDDKDFTKYYFDSKEDSLQFLQTWGGTWSAYGGAQAQTDWTNLRTFITSNSMTVAANYAYADSLLNVKSLADYVILNSYVVCSDWLNWNTAWWRGRNFECDKQKWRYALWDEDATFKHYINYTNIPNSNINASPCDPQSLNNPGGQGHVPVFNALLTNPTFKQYYVMRYFDLINTGLSCNRMTTILDSMINIMAPEMPKHITRWGGTMTEWQNNCAALKTFIQQRCDTVKKLFNACYNVTGPYTIKINVDPPNSGTVDFNSLNLSTFLWQGTYPGNLQNNLKAHAKTNYCFSHWTTKTHTLSPSFNDSIVTLLLQNNDSVVAHFIYNPPVTSSPVTSTLCQGNSVQLNASNGVNYNWTPSSGLSCITCSNPITNPSVTTVYTVTSFNNITCNTSKTLTVTVYPNANAGFNIAPTLTVVPQTVTITNTSSQAINYSWIFNPGGSTSTSVTPTFTIYTPGTYTVTMIAFGANNCNDTLSQVIVVNEISDTAKIYPTDPVTVTVTGTVADLTPTIDPVPNIFTPNGDGINDFFIITGKNIKEASCVIFDRWGSVVTELKAMNDKWDGYNTSGKECSAGTYFYVFKAVDILDQQTIFKGFVQLQR